MMIKLFARIALITVLFLTSCFISIEEPIIQPHEEAPPTATATPQEDPADNTCYRQRLAELGWMEEVLDGISGDVTYQIIYNQIRFQDYATLIGFFNPFGPTGMTIEPEFFGGLYFNDAGVLVVQITGSGFNDPDTLLAIEYLESKGIIIKSAVFTHDELYSVSNRLRGNWYRAQELGLTGSGRGEENAVTVWLDPYSEAYKAAFMDFLAEIGIDPAMVIFAPAATQEMVDLRAATITATTESRANPVLQVVLHGDVTVSQTGIIFALKNHTEWEFTHGLAFDLAYYSPDGWIPVPHLPGGGSRPWPAQGFHLQGGGINTYRQEWGHMFGELSPGRYVFIKEGSLGRYTHGVGYSHQEDAVVLVEFHVTASTPAELPPHVYAGREVLIHPVEAGWIYYILQGEGFLPSGGELAVDLDWSMIYGELPPGEYALTLVAGGRVRPPHPTGMTAAEMIIWFTVEE